MFRFEVYIHQDHADDHQLIFLSNQKQLQFHMGIELSASQPQQYGKCFPRKSSLHPLVHLWSLCSRHIFPCPVLWSRDLKTPDGTQRWPKGECKGPFAGLFDTCTGAMRKDNFHITSKNSKVVVLYSVIWEITNFGQTWGHSRSSMSPQVKLMIQMKESWMWLCDNIFIILKQHVNFSFIYHWKVAWY